jgi:hypothetical protein
LSGLPLVRFLSDRSLAALVGVGWALVAAATLTSAHTHDSVAYAGFVWLAVNGLGTDSLVQPIHLLFLPTVTGFTWLLGRLGLELPAHVCMQLFSALVSGAAAAALFLSLRRRFSREISGLVVASVLLTWSYWHFSSEMQLYMLATACAVLSFDRSLAMVEQPTPRSAATAGLLAALVFVNHAAFGLFGAGSFLVLLLQRGGRRIPVWAAFVLGAVLPVLCVFVPLLSSPGGGEPGDERVRSALSYAAPDRIGAHLRPPWRHWDSLLDQVPLAYVGTDRPWLALLPVTVALLLLGAGFARLFVRSETTGHRPALQLALAWLVPHAAFFSCWDAQVDYWLLTLVPGSLVLAHGMSSLTARLGTRRSHLAAATLPLALLLVNGPTILREAQPEENRDLRLAHAVAKSTPEDAVIVLLGEGPGLFQRNVYISYFASRRMWSLHRAASFERPWPPPWDAPAYLLSEALDPEALQDLERRAGVEDEAPLRRLVSGFQLELIGTLDGDTRLYRILGSSPPLPPPG